MESVRLEDEKVEAVVKQRVFTEEDYQEIVNLLRKLRKGRVDLLRVAEELYYEESLH